jgi:hypothetical protein
VTRRRILTFGILAAATLLASHDVVWLVQLGPGEELARALRTAGHDYWGAASVAIAVLAVLAALGVWRHLLLLSSRARGFEARSHPPAGLVRRSTRTWAALFVVVAMGFVLQENAEHIVMHAHPIGFGALLGPEYPLAIPVIAFFTAFAAIVVELIAGVERVLLERIAAALAARQRPTRRLWRPSRIAAHRSSVLSRMGASRAPPVVVSA